MSNNLEPLLDGEDIQGNILPGFNRIERYLVAFSCSDGERLRGALSLLRSTLTRMVDVLEHRDARKQAFLTNGPLPRRPDLWVNLALGPGAIAALGAAAVLTLDDDEGSFERGMTPGLVGDPFVETLPDGTPNPADRRNWKVGSVAQPVDLLLIFANDGDIENQAKPLVDEVARALGAEPNYAEVGRMLPGEVEHFGFRDGISQPGARGKVIYKGVERLVTTRYGVPPDQGIEFGKPGQPLVWPGQFLTGQPNSAVDNLQLAPELTNGSFLVFRRLYQHVKAFFDDTEVLAASLNAATGQAVQGSDLRTRIVGRFPNGGALMRHAHEPERCEGPNEINYFVFGTALPQITLNEGTVVESSAADPDVLRGRRCPVWAHIRKVNPRDQGTNRGGPESTVGSQMLRRGIPFGPVYDHGKPDNPDNAKERGLLFLSYQSKIAVQFEILNHDWMNNPGAPQAGGFDLLVGQKVSEDGLHEPKTATFFGPAQPGPGTDFETPNHWVIPTGGAFLFAPSLTFVAKYSDPITGNDRISP